MLVFSAVTSLCFDYVVYFSASSPAISCLVRFVKQTTAMPECRVPRERGVASCGVAHGRGTFLVQLNCK